MTTFSSVCGAATGEADATGGAADPAGGGEAARGGAGAVATGTAGFGGAASVVWDGATRHAGGGRDQSVAQARGGLHST
ncbi:MAG: hypothetical protein V9G29_19440 [Burkholderiaceae bacterium]